MTPINLSNADTSGPDFTPIKPGTYPATVFEASWGETQGGAGSKLPKGTPFINVQFKIDTTDAQDTDGKDLTGMMRDWLASASEEAIEQLLSEDLPSLTLSCEQRSADCWVITISGLSTITENTT